MSIHHLTFDELAEFASISELNRETEAKAAAVNKHLCECSHCRVLAAALTQVYEEIISKQVKTDEEVRILKSKQNEDGIC